MTSGKRYVVVQADKLGTWRSYLCAWVGKGAWVFDGIHEIPVFLYERDQALTFDEALARQLVDRFDERYRRVVLHSIEESS